MKTKPAVSVSARSASGPSPEHGLLYPWLPPRRLSCFPPELFPGSTPQEPRHSETRAARSASGHAALLGLTPPLRRPSAATANRDNVLLGPHSRNQQSTGLPKAGLAALTRQQAPATTHHKPWSFLLTQTPRTLLRFSHGRIWSRVPTPRSISSV